MKDRLTILGLLLVTLFMSGCSIIESPEELTVPPKLEGDKEGIRRAIEEYLPKNTKPIIPPTDDSGSYIKLVDLDGDGEDEALVFYNVELEDKPIRILVLKKEDDEWENINEIKVVGQDLDEVAFKDVDGKKGLEVIIGSKIKYSLDKHLSVYSMKGGKMERIFKNSYDAIIIDDLDGDKLTELMLLKLNRESDESYGELYKSVQGKIKQIDKVSFNDKAEINYAEHDYIYKNKKGIIISTTLEEDFINIYLMKVEDGKINNLLKDDVITTEKQEDTEIVSPRDIDRDGTIDFALPNSLQDDGESELINWVTSWYSFDGVDDIELKRLNYYDEKLNFTFELPLEWKDKIIITNLTKNENTIKQEEYVKVEYKANENSSRIHLFTVYIYDKDKLRRSEENQISEDYKELFVDSSRAYYIYENEELEKNYPESMSEKVRKIQRTIRLLEN